MSAFKQTIFTMLCLLMLSELSACAPAAIGGAAVGGSIAIDRRTSGIYLEDQNIELKSSTKLQQNLSEAAHVSTTSYNRNVLLTGQVASEEEKTLAVNLLKEIENVRNITDGMTIGPKTSVSTRTNDTYLTSKIKAQLVKEKRVSTNHIKVVTENGEVFLMGIVTSEEGNIAVDIARHTTGVKRVVKVFEYLAN